MIGKLMDVVRGKAPLRAKRSGRWPLFRASVIARNPTCAVCGGTEKLEVHHIRPFHEYPEGELDESNVLVLCESGRLGIICHRAIGHLGNYRRINPNVERDAAYLRDVFITHP